MRNASIIRPKDMTTFTQEDTDLFRISDKPLKAQAIKNSILPRLCELTNDAVADVAEIYQEDVFRHSAFVSSPAFRPGSILRREKFLDYTFARSGIAPQRNGEKWVGFRTTADKPTHIPCFELSYVLTEAGLRLRFVFDRRNLSMQTKKKLTAFISDHEVECLRLIVAAGARVGRVIRKDSRPIDSLSNCLKEELDSKNPYLMFFTDCIRIPTTESDCHNFKSRFAYLYPIYRAFISIAEDRPIVLLQQIKHLQDYLRNRYLTGQRKGVDRNVKTELDPLTLEKVQKNLDKAIRVMPAKRWLVFKRDNWRCVSCGRGADDGAILEVDHIIPRSKGGADTIDNYQTLCKECNIGKSNKDDTNIKVAHGSAKRAKRVRS